MKTVPFALAFSLLAALPLAAADQQPVRPLAPGSSRENLVLNYRESDFSFLSIRAGAPSGGTGAPSPTARHGQITHGDITVVKYQDKASAGLGKIAPGKHFPKAIITCNRMGSGFGPDFYTITMYDVTITNHEIGGSADRPTETLSLNYARIEFEYKPRR